MVLEHWVWPAFAIGIALVFHFSGDGWYRYPCQDPANWETPPCKPPICFRTKNCAEDLTGGVAP